MRKIIILLISNFLISLVPLENNLLNFIKMLFSFFMITLTGYYLFRIFDKKERSIFKIILVSFAFAVLFNYFLLIVLGLFNAVNYLTLILIYSVILLIQRYCNKAQFSFNFKKPDKILIIILIIILLPVFYYQITQDKYLLIDTLPYVASVQQINSFHTYNSFSNNPSPLYSKHQVLPVMSTYFGSLSIISGLQAVFALSGFLIIQNILLSIGFYLVSEKFFGKKNAKWSLLFFTMSFVWARSLDVRGTTMSFIFLAGALIYLNKKLLPIFLSLCLMTNAAIGVVIYLIVLLYGIFNFLFGKNDKAINLARSLIISVFILSIYIYSNINAYVSLLWCIGFLVLLVVIYGLTHLKINFKLPEKYIKPLIITVFLICILFLLLSDKFVQQISFKLRFCFCHRS